MLQQRSHCTVQYALPLALTLNLPLQPPDSLVVNHSVLHVPLLCLQGGPSSVSVVRPPRAKFIPLPESLTRPSTVLEAEDEGETSEYDAHLYQGTSHLSGWETQDEERRVLLGADVTSISRQASTEYVPPAGTVSTDQAALVAVRSKPEPGGRLTTVCLSDALDRQALEAVLRHHEPGCQFATYADVLHVHTPFGEVHRGGDCFFFDVSRLWEAGLRNPRCTVP